MHIPIAYIHPNPHKEKKRVLWRDEILTKWNAI